MQEWSKAVPSSVSTVWEHGARVRKWETPAGVA